MFGKPTVRHLTRPGLIQMDHKPLKDR